MLNKGFTMMEALLVIVILSTFSSLFTSSKDNLMLSDQIAIYNLSNSLINTQIDSLLQRSRNCLKEKYTINKYPICFNQSGNINLSQKISLINSNLSITVYLGAGTHEIK